MTDNPFNWHRPPSLFQGMAPGMDVGERPGTMIPGQEDIGPAWLTDRQGAARWWCYCPCCFWCDAYRGYQVIGGHWCGQCNSLEISAPDRATTMRPFVDQRSVTTAYLLGGPLAVAEMARREVQGGP